MNCWVYEKGREVKRSIKNQGVGKVIQPSENRLNIMSTEEERHAAGARHDGINNVKKPVLTRFDFPT